LGDVYHFFRHFTEWVSTYGCSGKLKVDNGGGYVDNNI